MRLLLISNSTNPGEPYLDYPKNNIKEFLGKKPVKALFIPYAAVTMLTGAQVQMSHAPQSGPESDLSFLLRHKI